MDFIYLDRGFNKTLVILPGWGFDYQIFPIATVEYNLIVPTAPLYHDISMPLSRFLINNRFQDVDILGWSLGSLSAYLFARRHETLVRNLILISSRNQYPEAMISELTGQVKKDKEKALKRFYLTSFYSQRADYRLFRRDHITRLLNSWTTTYLIQGLNFLLQFPIKPYNFTRLNLLTIHGEHDQIAPLSSIAPVTSAQKYKRLIIGSAGHLPFLRAEFHEILQDF